jgi:hypothetical protein
MPAIERSKDVVVIGCLFLLSSLTTNGLPLILKLTGGIPCQRFLGIVLTVSILDFPAFVFIIDS